MATAIRGRAVIPQRARKPVFGRHGKKVVVPLCTWEVVALVPGSPVPAISTVVRKYPVFGVVLLALLGHHWFLEVEELTKIIES